MEKYKGIYWVPVRLNPRFKHDPEEAALRIPVMNALKLIQGESNYVTFCKAMVIINDHRSRGVTEGEAKSNFRVLVEEITPGPDLAAARAHLLGQPDSLGAYQLWRMPKDEELVLNTDHSKFFLKNEPREGFLRQDHLMLFHHQNGVKICFPNLVDTPIGRVNFDYFLKLMLFFQRYSNVEQPELYFGDVMRASIHLIYYFEEEHQKKAILRRLERWEQEPHHVRQLKEGRYGLENRGTKTLKQYPEKDLEQLKQQDYDRIAEERKMDERARKRKRG